MSLAEAAGPAEKKKIYRINTGNVSSFPSVLPGFDSHRHILALEIG